MLNLVLLVALLAYSAESYQPQGGRGPQLIVEAGNVGGGSFGGGSHFGGGNFGGGFGGSFGSSGSFQGFDSGRQGVDRQTVTVTVRQTVDIITSEFNFVYNTLPVTFTDFRIETQTVATWQVVQTPGNDVVRVTTREENHPTTIQVTDTKRDFRFATNVVTDVITVTHTQQNVDFVTVTNTVQEQLTVTAAQVRTQVQTDYSTTTEMRYVTEYTYVGGYY